MAGNTLGRAVPQRRKLTLTDIQAGATHASHTGGFLATYLRAGTKEK